MKMTLLVDTSKDLVHVTLLLTEESTRKYSFPTLNLCSFHTMCIKTWEQKGNEISPWKRYLCFHVYCSIIHNSQDRETA